MLKRIGVFFCMTGMLLASSFSLAQDNPWKLTSAYTQCMNKEISTMGMLQCIGDEYTLQDKRLNKAYAVVLKDVSSERQKQLKEAQRAWIKFRDADCAFMYDKEGGTMAKIVFAMCNLDKTAQRATELEALMDSP